MQPLRQPFKISVWGPGGLGAPSVREVLTLPELELAAVFAYSESKIGQDAGAVVGVEPCGVMVTGDREAFFNTPAECVIYISRDYGDYRSDPDIIELLERGFNVITPLPYHYPKLRGEQIHAKLEAAGQKGGSTLYATGINPGFMFERLAMTATGMSNDVKHIKFEEYFDCVTQQSVEMLQLFGMGVPLDLVENNETVALLAENYLKQEFYSAGEMVGMPIDRVERSAHHVASPVDMNDLLLPIKAGTVGLVSYKWIAYSGDSALFSIQVYWYMGERMRPEGVPSQDFYRITVEGRPSMCLSLELQASIENNQRLIPGFPTEPPYYGTVIPMIQAIPSVCAASPGIMQVKPPSNSYWKKDMRL
ncbi:MAG: hypothetical protein ACI9FD_000873 [Gammaproteobacteria bacterium]|jgi:hypothetical protein